MSQNWDEIRDAMKSAILSEGARLVAISQEYQHTKERVGAGLAGYKELFGEIDFELPREVRDAMSMGRAPGITAKRRGRPSNADKAAAVLTRRGEVMVPLKMSDIWERLKAGQSIVGGKTPSLATLQSTIIRSGLFERMGGGLWRLTQPIEPTALTKGQLEIEDT